MPFKKNISVSENPHEPPIMKVFLFFIFLVLVWHATIQRACHYYCFVLNKKFDAWESAIPHHFFFLIPYLCNICIFHFIWLFFKCVGIRMSFQFYFIFISFFIFRILIIYWYFKNKIITCNKYLVRTNLM